MLLFSAELDGEPVPQGRPKVKTRPYPSVYYDRRSVEYRQALVTVFRTILWESPPVWAVPYGMPARLRVRASGMRKGADLDNLLKNVNDALVEAGVIRGDDHERLPDQRIMARGGQAGLWLELFDVEEDGWQRQDAAGFESRTP